VFGPIGGDRDFCVGESSIYWFSPRKFHNIEGIGRFWSEKVKTRWNDLYVAEVYLQKERLTQKEYWEDRWDRVRLPAIIDPTKKHPINKEILHVFEEFLPKEKLSAVEIGGAPGQFIAYLSKCYGYETSIIDYSEIGCQKAKQNFDLLGLNVNIYNRDFFDDLSDIPRFDLVLSMGFIEHFNDLDGVFQRHVNLLKKNGILVLGVPNFGGISQKVLARTAPDMLSRHNVEAMDLQNWSTLENTYGLVPLFKGYVGGFAPKNLMRCEQPTLKNLSIRYFFKMVHYLMSALPFLRKYNSPTWSAYLLGIYRLP
jgi:2-polyprenyl-3-methyl-5-hydroxy-6-metoxy-1,4-benzoquinol methylase